MKKLLFSIFVLSLLSLQAVSAYTDISESDVYSDNIARLSDFGIINGFSDGSFRPGDTLTRTQFAKIAVCMLDKEEEAMANSIVTPFYDVDQFYWGVPYINYVSKNAIIKGYTDGSFHPEAPITLAESVTVLLRSLGYTEEDVGYYWPNNYMDQAKALGMTDGVYANANDAITRAEAAILIDNTLFSDKKDTEDEFVKTLGYTVVEDAVVVATAGEDETLLPAEIKLGDDTVYEVKGFDGFKAMSYAEHLVIDEDGYVVSVQGYYTGTEGIEKVEAQGYNIIEDCYIIASSNEDRNLGNDEIRTSKGVYSVKDTDILNDIEKYGTLVFNKDKKVIYAYTSDTPYTEYVVKESFDGGIEYISSNNVIQLTLNSDFPVYVDYKEKENFSEITDEFVSGSELTIYSGDTYTYGVLDTNAGYSILDECFIIATKDDDKSLSAEQVRTSNGVYKVKSTDIMAQAGNIGTVVVNSENKIEQFIPTSLDRMSVVANKLTDNTLEYIKEDGSKDSYKFDNTFVTYLDYNKSTFSSTKGEITAGTDITLYGEYGDWDFAVIDLADDIVPVLASRNYTGSENTVEGISINRDNLIVYRGGEASDLSEIQKNDVIYYNPKTNTMDVYTDKVTGIYYDAKPSKAYVASVVVGGVEYVVDTTAVSALDASRGSFEIGEQVTLLFGKDNKAVFAVELSDSVLYDYGVLIDTYTNIKNDMENKGKSEIIAKLFMPDGSILEYAADKDYKDYKGDLMKLSFADGTVTLTKAPTSKISGEINVDGRTLGGKNVLKDVSVLQRISDEDDDTVEVELVNWDTLDIGMLSESQAITYIPANAFGDVQILYVEDFTNQSYEYAMVIGSSSSENGDTYKLFKDGKTETVTSESSRTVYAGIPAAYKESGGKIEDIFNLYQIAKASDIDAIDGARIMINNKIYNLSSDVVFYLIDNTKSNTKYETLSLTDMQNLNSKDVSRVVIYSDVSSNKNGSIKAVVVTK